MKRNQVNAMLKESESKRAGADESCDSQLKEAVFARFASSGHCGLRSVQVHVDQQRVLLFGEVTTYFLKQTAQEVARVVCPHHQLKNSIVVREPPQSVLPGRP